ncbi:MAG: hypothetical protein IPG61_12105 [bacterium]|nr:hypothetical protein [bacterium]
MLRGGHLQQVQKMMMDPTKEDLVADMRGLLDGTDFMPRVQALLKTLEMYLQSPVETSSSPTTARTSTWCSAGRRPCRATRRRR